MLVKDNYSIIQCIGDEEIRKFITLLQAEKKSEYIDFLAVLCECAGNAVKSNQRRICRDLLEEGGEGMVFLTELNPKTNEMVVSVSGLSTTGSWQSMFDFVKSAMDDDDR